MRARLLATIWAGLILAACQAPSSPGALQFAAPALPVSEACEGCNSYDLPPGHDA